MAVTAEGLQQVTALSQPHCCKGYEALLGGLCPCMRRRCSGPTQSGLLMRHDVSKGSDEDNTGLCVHVRSSSRNPSTQPRESSPVISSWQSQTNYLQFHLSKSFGNVSRVKRVGLTGGLSKALGPSQVRKGVGHWPWLNRSPPAPPFFLVHMSESHWVPVWQGLGSALSEPQLAHTLLQVWPRWRSRVHIVGVPWRNEHPFPRTHPPAGQGRLKSSKGTAWLAPL